MIKQRFIGLANNPENISVKENFSFFTISLQTRNKPDLNIDLIKDIVEQIDSQDNFDFIFKIDDGDALILNKNSRDNGFNDRLNNHFQYYEEGETVFIKLEILKLETGDIRTIYSYEDFMSFLNELKLTELLEVLNKLFRAHSTIHLKTLESDIKSFSTAKFTLNAKKLTKTIQSNTSHLNDNCHFGNSENYIVNPDYFNPIIYDNTDFKESFDALCCLFSMIYIFDVTTIENEKLKYKINGFKTLQGEISIDNHLHGSKEVFYELYDWCYSSEGSVTDKLGLTRNIISVHYKDNIEAIDTSVLASVKSAHKTYLKENVSKYIELRGKIHDELSWISQKSSEIVENYISSYQKSVFTFLSFFISVFVLRIISGNGFANVFNKDVSVLSVAFLAISTVILIFSSFNLIMETSRLERKYKNLKERYKDLLVKKDIDTILNRDKEFNYEMSYINKRYCLFLSVWIITILILLAAILLLSDTPLFK